MLVGIGDFLAAQAQQRQWCAQVSVSYIYKALIRRRVTGEVTARPSGGGPRPKLAPHDDALRARIAAEPDITLAELQAWLLAERQVTVSIGCLWNRLQFLDLPLKKSRSELPSRIGRTSPRLTALQRFRFVRPFLNAACAMAARHAGLPAAVGRGLGMRRYLRL